MTPGKQGRASWMRWWLNTLLVAVSVTIGFMAINASFPVIYHQSIFPRGLVWLAGGLQYTLYPDTYDPEQLESWVAVVGDSYAEGAGDSFLDGDPQYSIAHHLREITGKSYFIFGRSGFGSIDAARELVVRVGLMNQSFLFPDLGPPAEILVIFYEGNDLNNNISQLAKVGESRTEVRAFVQSELGRAPPLDDRIDSFLPFARLFYDIALDYIDPLFPVIERKPPEVKSNRLDLQGEELVVAPLQSAAMELSTAEIERALAAFDDCLEYLHDWSPDAAIRVVYVPSVVTTYHWHQPVEIQTYHSDAVVYTSSEENLRHSELMRTLLAQAVMRRGFEFIDTTDPLRARARTERLHGPRDWAHPNARGYQLIAELIASRKTS